MNAGRASVRLPFGRRSSVSRECRRETRDVTLRGKLGYRDREEEEVNTRTCTAVLDLVGRLPHVTSSCIRIC